MSTARPVLLTGVGAGGSSVSRMAADLLLDAGLPVRVMIHHDDGRADALRTRGAEIAVGDLADPAAVNAAMQGVRRVFFNMALVPDYLRAAAVVTSIAAEHDLEALVNVSQMTVSQMTSTSSTESDHQRLHWLAEQIMAWSPVPVVQLRPTIFLDNPLFTVLPAAALRERDVLALPIGVGRTSPVTAADVARVAAVILREPTSHIGQVYELTGPEVLDLAGLADEYGRALGRPVTGVDLSEADLDRMLRGLPGLSDHLAQHVRTLVALHHAGRYDRLTETVERLTGVPAESVEHFVARNRGLFTPSATR